MRIIIREITFIYIRLVRKKPARTKIVMFRQMSHEVLQITFNILAVFFIEI